MQPGGSSLHLHRTQTTKRQSIPGWVCSQPFFPQTLQNIVTVHQLTNISYVEILESKCQVLIGGLIELDRLRKNLPPPKTQSATGLASGKLANQILKEIGINTTLTDSDLEDEDDNHEPGFYHDDSESMASATGSPEPVAGDGWEVLSHQMQNQHPQWNQNPLRHPSHYYSQTQVMDTSLLPPSPPTAIDYNLSTRPHTSANSPYYPHAELQTPAAVADPSILPPSPPTAVDYSSPHPSTSAPYSSRQQLPHAHYFNDMDVFVDLNTLAPAPEEQNY